MHKKRLSLALAAALILGAAGEAAAAFQLRIPVNPGGGSAPATPPGKGGVTVSASSLNVILSPSGSDVKILTVTNSGTAVLPDFGVDWSGVPISPDGATTCPSSAAPAHLGNGASCSVVFSANGSVNAAAGSLVVMPSVGGNAADNTTVTITASMPLAVGMSPNYDFPVIMGGTAPYTLDYAGPLFWREQGGVWQACSSPISGLGGAQGHPLWAGCAIPDAVTLLGNVVEDQTVTEPVFVTLGPAVGIALPMPGEVPLGWTSPAGAITEFGAASNMAIFAYDTGNGQMNTGYTTSTGADYCTGYELRMQATVSDAGGQTATGEIRVWQSCY